MQEAPYSDRKAEELRRSRIMGVDTAIRSNSSKHFDKSREEFNIDSAFMLPFAVFAFIILVMIVYTQIAKNSSAREEQLRILEGRYGATGPFVTPHRASSNDCSTPPSGL